MNQLKIKSAISHLFIGSVIAATMASNAQAEQTFSNKLLLTGGVSQVEGAAGGGLTPWALIGGYGTNNEIGGNVHYTYAKSSDYRLDSYGFTVGFYDRVEFSVAEQRFDISKLRNKVEAALPGAIGRDTLDQMIVGLKVRVLGEAVLDADTWMPQVAVGLQYKENNDSDFVKSAVVGAKSDHGTDIYARREGLGARRDQAARAAAQRHRTRSASRARRVVWRGDAVLHRVEGAQHRHPAAGPGTRPQAQRVRRLSR